ncbi:MAG TPA: filamentous hemagglutinin N-terminal domain-containing protein, partial [Methylophilaceae bacterium]|nr:filamentous hemagglutinin N-terminal domain-containing protein [Methylophilaceae bacterium]
MNRVYRLIWNERLNAWTVVSELARTHGKRSGLNRSATALLLALGTGTLPAWSADLASNALPGGGTVTAGQASITTSGTRMDVNQGSQKAILNWQNFDIGSQAFVNFNQPNASAVALNRVSGPTASRIEGQLSANGQVFLVNPNGVIFGNGARVNVGGLAVSTLDIRDQDFLNGNYTFSGTGGAMTNLGDINAAAGGYLAFIAPAISNYGKLNAPQGTVAMGAGENVRLNFAGDRLVGLDVSASKLDTLIENHQAIKAEGGAILLTAAAAEGLTNSVINNTGVLEAGSLTSKGGVIRLESTLATNTGTINASGVNGGEITVHATEVRQGGTTSATGSHGVGGTVKLLGDRVALIDHAIVDASGTAGGGTVLVGGDYQGKNPDIQNAQRTYVASTATIKADATERGDGGKVVVWADGDTRYYGNISAKGGNSAGNGGFVEVSGKQNLDFNGGVNVGATEGIGGRVLLDPQNIVLSTAVAAPPPNNPNGTPDIAFADPPAVGTTNVQISTITGFSELFLQATNDITVSNPVAMAANNSIR